MYGVTKRVTEVTKWLRVESGKSARKRLRSGDSPTFDAVSVIENVIQSWKEISAAREGRGRENGNGNGATDSAATH
jgi:hypothetical protein